jgi:hypothetical protein
MIAAVVVALAAFVAFLLRRSTDEVRPSSPGTVLVPDERAVVERRRAAAPEIPPEPAPAVVDPAKPAAKATVVVRVVAEEDKSPLAGASVVVKPDQLDATTATTDAAGVVRVDAPAGVSVEVYATATDRVASEKWSTDTEAGKEATIDLELERGVAFDGVVLDAARGTPIDGARVEVVRGGLIVGYGDSGSDAPPLGRVVTGGDGRFRVRAPVGGLVTATASAKGFVADGRATVVGDGARPPVVLRLAAAGTLSGAVRAPDGAPAANAKVYVVPGHVRELLADPDGWWDAGDRRWTALVATTDAAGRYEIDGLDRGGLYVALAKGADWAPSEAREAVFATEERPAGEADFRLRRPGTLVVHVVDAAGIRTPATLSFQSVGGPAQSAAVASTGDETVGVSPGAVDVIAEVGGRPTATERVDVADGATVEVVVRIPDAVAIAGVVVDDRGEPTAGARVGVGSGRNDRSVTDPQIACDKEGRFRVGGLRAGPHWIAARRAERGPNLAPTAVDAPADAVRLVVPRLARVQMRFMTSSGPLTGVRYPAWKDEVAGDVAWAGASSLVNLVGSGPIMTGWFAAGRLHARVEFEGYAPLTLDFTARPGEELDLGDVMVDPGIDLVGRVEDAHGTPVPGALVTVGDKWEVGHRETTTAVDGGFRLTHVAGGPTGVRVAAPDFLLKQVDADVQSGAATLVVLLERGGLVRVTVVDSAGAPAVGVYVEVGDRGGDTDHRGVARVRAPVGQTRVAVDGRDATADVDVVEGVETPVRLVLR